MLQNLEVFQAMIAFLLVIMSHKKGLEIAFEQKAHINLDDITSFRRLKKMGHQKKFHLG
ncbi:hypothetical protein Ct9H90mP29_02910 [bacterium]|nr:MAG: hypothetical protein Ct9H90mP29_02910 [bacterium]